METSMQKATVADPMALIPTVGEELSEIFALNGKNIALLGINDIESKETISSDKLRKAADILGLDTEFVSGMQMLQSDYKKKKEESRAEYSKMKAYYRKLKKVVPLLRDEFNDGIDVLDDIVHFFGQENEQEVFDLIGHKMAMYRSKTNSNIDEIALAAWLRRGEIDYGKTSANTPEYNSSELKKWIDEKEWQTHIDDQKYFKSLPEILCKFGVGLVLLPYLPKTVYGAVEWMDNRPVIIISDREQDLATCWFTLFHELGHILLHEKGLTIDVAINENTGKSKTMQREREANKFANDKLYNGDNLRKYVFFLKQHSDKNITTGDVAKKFHVHPMFAGYWMRKAQLTQYSFERVSISFSE